MKAEAKYIPLSTRRAKLFAKAADKTGLTPEEISDLYKYHFFATTELQEFISWILSPMFSRSKLDPVIELVRQQRAKQTVAPETPRMKAMRDLIDNLTLGDDATDRLNWEAKKALQIGDLIPAPESKSYNGGVEYATKGKVYPVLSVEDNGYGKYTVELGTNLPREVQYLAADGISEIYRGTERVWSRQPESPSLNDNQSTPSAQAATAA